MPTIASSNIPTPKSWDEFEEIALCRPSCVGSRVTFTAMNAKGRNKTVWIFWVTMEPAPNCNYPEACQYGPLSYGLAAWTLIAASFIPSGTSPKSFSL